MKKQRGTKEMRDVRCSRKARDRNRSLHLGGIQFVPVARFAPLPLAQIHHCIPVQ